MNPPATQKSTAYTEFPAPINNGIRGKPSPALLKKKKKTREANPRQPPGGFDVHIYFLQSDPTQVQYATELWERIRRECNLSPPLPIPCFPPPVH